MPREIKTTAKRLVEMFGDKLIGQLVGTQAVGEYPGGIATILDLGTDPGAPEIVFNVNRHGWGEIGVFDHERVVFLAKEEG